jgi:PIN domain nuclease of toxin-antitoxin system
MPRVSGALEDPTNEKWVSPISVWELVILVEKKRVVLNVGVDRMGGAADVDSPAQGSTPHYGGCARKHGHAPVHRDPADTFLLATAKVFDLTLVTSDARLLTAKGISLLPNR